MRIRVDKTKQETSNYDLLQLIPIFRMVVLIKVHKIFLLTDD